MQSASCGCSLEKCSFGDDAESEDGVKRPSNTREKALGRYNEKRDFGTTDEPQGEVRSTTGGNSYVIQKHAATALHFDFRLELDGVLLSWAVPKGPSLSTKERRLAVQTEDHPVDYRGFEGTIPKGEYGGGDVIVWDRGTWEPVGDPREGMKKGKLEFIVHGEKLNGKFRLIRIAGKDDDRGKKNWLLMKGTDEHVRHGAEGEIVARRPASVLTGRTIENLKAGVPAVEKGQKPARHKKRKPAKRRESVATTPAPRAVDVQLATLVDSVPVGVDWLYEIKYDGYRAVATVKDGRVTLTTRGGKDWTEHFPTIADALSHARVRSAVMDGEIAYVLDDGRTDFQKLQNALKGADKVEKLVYFIFDLLHYDGVDLTGETLEVRKDKLRALLAGVKLPLKLGDDIRGNGQALFDKACKLGLEGIIAKRADRPYRSGRGPDWVKVKCQKRQELVIVGSTLPKGKRVGIGALLLAVRDGTRYRYVGKVGTGFSQASLRDLVKRLKPLRAGAPTAEGAPRMRDVKWAKPELVCQVRFTEWTKGGALRHPAFEGLREDKKASAVVREIEVATEPVSEARSLLSRIGTTKITHAERIVDIATGITKSDMARYIEKVAPHFLTFAAKRPLMLLRCTNAWPASSASFGSQGRKAMKGSPCFVQKHAGLGLTNVGQQKVGDEEVIYVTRREELYGLVQLNAFELHGWGSRLPKIEKPDWIVLDLDPDPELPFVRVVDAALELRHELTKLGLVSFVKTTGGKGLHVVVPLTPREEWPVVSAFAAALAQALAKRSPTKYVATMTKAARMGKVFIDHFRNGRGQTAILPYSPRARTGAPVAMPVAWEELKSIEPRAFDVLTVPAILAGRRIDPWAGLPTTRQLLPRAIVKGLRDATA
jgi:bifunctional non-homologous end joining protein LigD